MIVVDTSVLIDHLRGRPEAHRALRQAVEADQRLAGSLLTKVEITTGLRSSERGAVEALFRAVEWLPVTAAIADDAGVLARRYRRSHESIDVVDYVIAATARSLDASVWTLNVKHFPMIDGLRPPFRSWQRRAGRARPCPDPRPSCRPPNARGPSRRGASSAPDRGGAAARVEQGCGNGRDTKRTTVGASTRSSPSSRVSRRR